MFNKFTKVNKIATSYSYGDFYLNNRHANSNERRRAVKRFLDYTRDGIKDKDYENDINTNTNNTNITVFIKDNLK